MDHKGNQDMSNIRGIKSVCGKWLLVAAESGIPKSGFYGFTHDEVMMLTGVLPRAREVQDLLDAAHAALDAADGLVWPERVYVACRRLWVYRVVNGFGIYIPVLKVRASIPATTTAPPPVPLSTAQSAD